MISKDIYPLTSAIKLSWRNASVHYNSKTRFNKAREEALKTPVPVEEIIDLTNEFLGIIGIKQVANPKRMAFEFFSNQENILDYEEIKNTYQLNNRKHLIWMKFTKDGYLGVVAVSDDVNFTIPSCKEDYNKKTIKNGKTGWKFNTSGIIIHSLGKTWDESFVLVFPLPGIGDGQRNDIECGVGQYLISKNVPILDYYSHRY